jgi:small nuclear ribonucleoprotein (snRNP)-like protein
MKGDKEFAGTLLGFDDYVNMVLEDVTELYVLSQATAAPANPQDFKSSNWWFGEAKHEGCVLTFEDSDFSGGQTKLPKILLNGNNICMVS